MLECNVNLTVYLLVCRETPCCTEVVRDSGLYAWIESIQVNLRVWVLGY